MDCFILRSSESVTFMIVSRFMDCENPSVRVLHML